MFSEIVLTGTSGAGKTTVARILSEARIGVRLVRAVTTRCPRSDDFEGQYDQVTAEEFGALKRSNALLVTANYRDRSYGVRRSDVDAVRAGNETPILVVTPQAASDIVGPDCFEDSERKPLVVFMDSDDGTLDERLGRRSEEMLPRERDQRMRDRGLAQFATYTVRGGTAEDAARLITALWQARDRGGVLPKNLIQKFLACGTLLENAEGDNVQGASYDLRLGDEYYYRGKIHKLSGSMPILNLEPYDYAIVTSQERADLPRDVSGRFDLTVGLFCQGVILSNGPQVDAGFRGPLFCLLFNTSSSPVLLKRRQHYATIEFHKTLWPTERYGGPYQAKTLIDYLPSNAARGAINELKRDLEKMRREAKNMQATMWGILALILAMIAVFVAFQ